MTKNSFIALVAILCYQTTFAQKASEVLENGIPVKKGNSIFLKYDLTDKTLKIDDAKKGQPVNFTTIEDSAIYLVRKNEINIYLRPLNPINYTFYSETKVIIDPINEAAEKALGDILGVLENVTEEIQKMAPDRTSNNTNRN